jgi:3-polyprenyl-4-hydroxybenzoate decarboxylase
MGLRDIPTENKLVVALTGAIGIVWAIDWLESVGVQKYKMVLLFVVVLLIFMEYNNDS